MTLILKTTKRPLLLLLLAMVNLTYAQAPASQTLTVSPTLFEMKAERGQAWTSELRIINVNDYDLTVYPEVVNFAPFGEDGRGDLIPIFADETGGKTLAEWITLPSEPIVVAAQQTVNLPIAVSVPTDAPPGGHYAAILVGTKPPTDESGSKVQTAQFVTALFFVRIAGAVNEAGTIREFTTEHGVVQEPRVELSMRFQNTGNVHLQPQGDIKIFNMWGQERGMIPVNHQTQFGNVLPESIRKFTFTWMGETAIYDIGRYKAVATLGYGEEAKQFVTSTTYFWIIPYTTIIVTLFGILLVAKFVMWLIRRYIERMIAASGVPLQAPYVPTYGESRQNRDKTVVVPRATSIKAVVAPMRDSARVFATSWKSATSWAAKIPMVVQLLRQYALPLAITLALLLIAAAIMVTVRSVTREATHFAVAVDSADADVILSSEEITYDQLRAKVTLPTLNPTSVPITVVNVSGKVGAGAKTRLALEEAGYPVYDLTTDSTRTDEHTVIVYDPADQELALALSRVLTGALLSASETDSDAADSTITIFAGQDSL